MSLKARIRLLAAAFFALQVGLLVVSYLNIEGMPLVSNLWVTAAYVIADGVTIALLTRHLLSTLDRMEEAYATEVEDDLEESLRGYLRATHAQNIDAARIAQGVSRELERARADLAEARADGVDAHLRAGLSLARSTADMPCANPTVAAILDSKRRQCADAGVTLDAQASLPPELPLPDVDLAAVFFNLIDNALHECEALAADGTTGLVVSVRAFVRAGQLVVSVENPSRPRETRRSARQRREETGQCHGWGTEIVATMAERHGGIAEFAQEGDVFAAQVMIPLA